jgi:hypothetical protein
MNPKVGIISFLGALCLPVSAETVVITTVPEENRPLSPLTSLGGIPLDANTQVRVGAFSGLDNDELLDLASDAGLTAVLGAFSSFGSAASIGQGVDGAAGGFEISVREANSVPWDGEAISLLLQSPNGEFLIARFNGRVFQSQSETGLETLHLLHLADAELVAGNRTSTSKFSTSPAPGVGSFTTWIEGFASITIPAMKLPGADADGDGRSNFFEYATGGNPTSTADTRTCDILPDGLGGMWVRFRRQPGLGAVRYTPQFSPDLQDPWISAAPSVQPDPEDASVLRLRLAPPLAPLGFFRLVVE